MVTPYGFHKKLTICIPQSSGVTIVIEDKLMTSYNDIFTFIITCNITIYISLHACIHMAFKSLIVSVCNITLTIIRGRILDVGLLW